MTVGELLDRISSRELSEWQEFARVEPFGEDREDLRAAYIAFTIACTVPRAKGDRSGPKFEDFLLKFGWEESEPESPEQLAAKIKAAFAAYGAPVTTETLWVPKGNRP